jgi:hypothetical protein
MVSSKNHFVLNVDPGENNAALAREGQARLEKLVAKI